MIKAQTTDRATIVRILTQSFDDNKSVNYIIPQDRHRITRITRLMEYSFDYCQLFGDIYSSDNRQACALIIYPRKVKTTIRSILLDLRLILQCVGLTHLRKALKRESVIKRLHPRTDFCYLWFIGVSPDVQHKGIGTTLLKELSEEQARKKLRVYLETSVERNIPWYEKWGFTTYQQLDFGYTVYCMKSQ